jgi:long-subunit fatty acid transport protein
MIKKIVVSLCLLISFSALAQEGTSTPYSFYGIGDIKFKGTIETRAMGGLNVFPDSIHINLQNPAHFASLKLTTFSIGGTYANTKSQSETQEEKSRRTAFDYLAVGIPIGKLGLSFGLIPYSSVGYKIQKITYYTNNTAPFDTIRAVKANYRGIGGINKVFFGFGYKLNKNFNVGADIQYNFGTIETNNLTTQTGIQYGTREINTSNAQGFNADFGLTYQAKINKKLSFFSSFTYSPESELRLDNSREIQLTQEFADQSIRVIETEDVDVANTTIKIPSKLSFGSGFGEVKKWLLGAEVTLLENSAMSNRFVDINGGIFENSVRYSLGGYFIPNYNSYSKYFKRVTYRAGLRYENTGLVIVRPGYENKSITDTAFNVGFGLPLGGSFSKINIGLEMGRKGTIYNNLVEENYFNVSIGLSLSDKWFVKRKFD